MSKGLTNELERLVKRIIEEELDAILSVRGIEATPKSRTYEISKQKARILRDLEKRGYLLEYQVFKKLKDMKDWETELQMSYWDLKSETMPSWREYAKDVELQMNKSYLQKDMRTIDLKAEKTVDLSNPVFHSSTVELVIDCKHRTKDNWVFIVRPPFGPEMMDDLLSDDMGYGIPAAISLFNSLKQHRFTENLHEGTVNRILGKEYESIGRVSHHSIANLKEYATVGYTAFSEKDSLSDSYRQVLDAAYYREASKEWNLFTYFDEFKQDRRKKCWHWHIYPVIVIDSPVWILSYDDEGEIQLKEANWVPYRVVRNDYYYMIDIVTWNGFDEYMNLIEREINEITKL